MNLSLANAMHDASAAFGKVVLEFQKHNPSFPFSCWAEIDGTRLKLAKAEEISMAAFDAHYAHGQMLRRLIDSGDAP